MLISPNGLLADFGQRFADTARAPLPSVAEPPWFAPPVDVRGDADSLTIVFHVPEEVTRIRVDTTESSVFLTGRLSAKPGRRQRRGRRVFVLPFEASRGSATLARVGDLVHVRIRRRQQDARLLPPSDDESPEKGRPPP